MQLQTPASVKPRFFRLTRGLTRNFRVYPKNFFRLEHSCAATSAQDLAH